MSMPGGSGAGRPLLILAILLAISVLLDGYLIAPLFPLVSQAGGIKPMIVFLDIPVGLPVSIDLLPVGLLFSLFYSIYMGSNPARYGNMSGSEIGRRLALLLGGALSWILWIVGGALAFYYAHDYIPKEVRNGIDSFGVQMDIYDPVPGYEVIHLKGSMILLVCAIIGTRVLLKRAVRSMQPPVIHVQQQPEPVMATRIINQVQEPEEIPMPVEPYRPRTVLTRVPVVAPARVELPL